MAATDYVIVTGWMNAYLTKKKKPTKKGPQTISEDRRPITEGEMVLDNCMGSGTTAIACIKERRHFIGFELSKEYFDKAVRRIKAEQAQLTLF